MILFKKFTLLLFTGLFTLCSISDLISVNQIRKTQRIKRVSQKKKSRKKIKRNIRKLKKILKRPTQRRRVIKHIKKISHPKATAQQSRIAIAKPKITTYNIGNTHRPTFNQTTINDYIANNFLLSRHPKYLDIKTEYPRTHTKFTQIIAQEAFEIVQEICRTERIDSNTLKRRIESHMLQYLPQFLKFQNNEQCRLKKGIAENKHREFNGKDLEKLIFDGFKIQNNNLAICCTEGYDGNWLGGLVEWDTAVYLKTEENHFTPGILGHELSHVKNHDILLWECLSGAFGFNQNNAPAWYWRYRRLCEKRADIESALLHPAMCQSLVDQFKFWQARYTRYFSGNSQEHPPLATRIAYLDELYADMLHEQATKTNWSARIAVLYNKALRQFGLAH
ncbi:MAG TPA: hypothetical protein VJ201_08605 [Candidatus Babeliales bacterium]|nr:hypothetical protein [Candidatus Babeliales bacterium]